jgi:flagellar assembly protein FliH
MKGKWYWPAKGRRRFLSKEFTPDSPRPEVTKRSSFHPTWPELLPGNTTSSFQQYLGGIEEKVLKEAKKKALFIEKEAYEKGFEQGERDGLALGQKRIETTIQQLKELLLEMRGQQEKFWKAYEKEILELIFSIAKKVIRHEIELHPNIITATFREAFQYIVERDKIVVHLHPVDYQYLLAHPEQIPFILNDQEGVKVIEDHSITRGGCLLMTSFGEIDATIESQFDEIVSLVVQRWKRLGGQGEESSP